MTGKEGRALNIRGSASSFLTSTSSFSFPFRVLPDRGDGAGVEACETFCFPFPFSLSVPRLDDNKLADNKLADAERVKRFVGVSGSSDNGGVINCFESAAVGVEDALALWPRVAMMERSDEWLLLGVEGRSSADDKEVRADDERAVIAGDNEVRADGAGDAIPGVSGVGNEEGPATACNAELDCALEFGSDVSSEALSTSATSSISPPPTTSFGMVASSTSLSLSSESSSSIGITAYTPRRVRRSFRFSPDFFRSPSELDSFESESESKSESESDSESELIGGSSSV
jgi:hypothetical protein